MDGNKADGKMKEIDKEWMAIKRMER